MARQSLFRKLKQISSEFVVETANGPVNKNEDSHLSRRQFLLNTVALTAASRPLSAIEKLIPASKAFGPHSRTVILGAGVSGLVASYRLVKAGVEHQMYEIGRAHV